MANTGSPDVAINEIDLTTTIPMTGSAGSASVAEFMWGPAYERVRNSRREDLEANFHKPTNKNAVDWLTAANFLAYSGALTMVRAIGADAINSSDDGTGILIENAKHFAVVDQGTPGVKFAAKYPGKLGDSIEVQMADAASFLGWRYASLFDEAPGTSTYGASVGAKNDELHVVIVDRFGKFTGTVGGVIKHFPYLSKAIDGKDENNAPAFYKDVINQQSQHAWVLEGVKGDTKTTNSGGQLKTAVVGAKGQDYTTATVAVGGGGTGAVVNATITGGEIVALTIVNPGSGYTNPTLTITGDGTGATATATAEAVTSTSTVDFGSTLVDDQGKGQEFNSLDAVVEAKMTGGKDSTTLTAADYLRGWDLLKNAEEVDVSTMYVGSCGGDETILATVMRGAIDNVALRRKDIILALAPPLSTVLGKTPTQADDAMIAFKQTIGRAESFVAWTTGWKQVYDVFSNKTRMIPMDSDLSGLMARVTNESDDWFSPAGYTRGKLRNVEQLVYNPDKDSRDVLYKANINPIVFFADDGFVLYGDRTAQGKNSAFSQIGIRRMFIRLQKSIKKAAKYAMFDFNDDITRAAFVNMVTPYMREVKGRRGIDDFRVVCDTSNNTPQVIQAGEFVGAIYVKPQYSIQWIRLDFVAVRREVDFSEVVITNA